MESVCIFYQKNYTNDKINDKICAKINDKITSLSERILLYEKTGV